ncbi:MAG: DEAD/DEAH box helicase [Phycisphaerales bacterium]|nr:DEAD/DEAH box helicase [Phycisphaerales bacterium]
MSVAEWLSPNGLIARGIAEFEPRPQQLEMALAVQRAFESKRHLAVEAGTGVGKTFAYLLPAIARVLAGGHRVVISTHTIALQEQLVQKDIPTLLHALELDIPVELVKGRNNYLGLRRLKLASQRQNALFPDQAALRVLHSIEDWAYQTEDGSLSDLETPPPFDVWEKVRSEHDNCMGRRCPTFEKCFYQQARRRAERAGILIVNHSLLASDLMIRRDGASLLPDHDLMVIDEAHTFDQVAADYLGLTISNAQVMHLLGGLFNDRTGKGLIASLGLNQQRDAAISAARAADQFFQAISDWQRTRGRANGRLMMANPIANGLTSALRHLTEQLRPIVPTLAREEDRLELQSAIDRTEAAATGVEAVLTQKFAEYVYWIELESGRQRRVALCAAPIDPGDALRSLLFERVSSVVMTSATLAADGASFQYSLSRLGQPPADTLQLGSPFDYPNQARVVVEAGMPDPTHGPGFTGAAAHAIVHWLRQTEGRAFVLFTSYEMLRQVADLVRDELNEAGFTILVQGEGLPRTKMLEKFRETPLAAIFGADSFWQGVDVAGDALSNVIIVKLPFAVPDRPNIEGRNELIRKRGGNPFNDFQLPEAILRFRQGFGRLIRSRNDRGVVVVLDPRVVTKPYGRRFLQSLPPAPVETLTRAWS